MTYRDGRLRLRIDVTGTFMLGAAIYFLVVGQDSTAFGFGVLAGLSSIAFAIDGLRVDLADR